MREHIITSVGFPPTFEHNWLVFQPPMQIRPKIDSAIRTTRSISAKYIPVVQAQAVQYGTLAVQKIKTIDRKRVAQEAKELALYINKQFFSQIPGVSALAGIGVGTWVAGTFTTSKFWGTLAQWGWTRGPSIVVSGNTYKFLSVFLPVLATAVTAYAVQKILSTYRRKRLESDMRKVNEMDDDTQDAVEDRLAVLDQAQELGLISKSEHYSKRCALYQKYACSGLYKYLEMLLHRFA